MLSGANIGNKVRDVATKNMWVEGNITEATLFGQNLFTGGGKYVTITEGEVDAMSAYRIIR